MKKTLLQGIVLICIVIGSWLLLREINWLDLFKFQSNVDKIEKNIGDLLIRQIKLQEEIISDVTVTKKIDSIFSFICIKNNLNKKDYKVVLVSSQKVNAISIPDNYIIIYSGLIDNSNTLEELVGVICHELAHHQLNHIMKKIVKEFGIATIMTMASGKDANKISKSILSTLVSTGFDREMETEADRKAISYMKNANINPAGLANFLYRNYYNTDTENEVMEWISTHPNSQQRAEDIVKNSNMEGNNVYTSILSQEEWNILKEKVTIENEDE